MSHEPCMPGTRRAGRPAQTRSRRQANATKTNSSHERLGRGGGAYIWEAIVGMVTVCPQDEQGPVWPANRSATFVWCPQWGQVNAIVIRSFRGRDCFDWKLIARSPGVSSPGPPTRRTRNTPACGNAHCSRYTVRQASETHGQVSWASRVGRRLEIWGEYGVSEVSLSPWWGNCWLAGLCWRWRGRGPPS